MTVSSQKIKEILSRAFTVYQSSYRPTETNETCLYPRNEYSDIISYQTAKVVEFLNTKKPCSTCGGTGFDLNKSTCQTHYIPDVPCLDCKDELALEASPLYEIAHALEDCCICYGVKMSEMPCNPPKCIPIIQAQKLWQIILHEPAEKPYNLQWVLDRIEELKTTTNADTLDRIRFYLLDRIKPTEKLPCPDPEGCNPFKQANNLPKKPTQTEIDDFIFDIEEVVCENVTEPAGHGCGYGIREEGQIALTECIKKFLGREGKH